ncbi:MAG: DUF1890 domain-containing protein [Methanomicrobiaceae archaeon]|nr:DUF1890 domain-containing protein [Methanomicrobiaceae archaeon]
MNNYHSALVVLGCPQVPIQTSAALYLLHGLNAQKITTVAAGTKSALALLEVGDPERHYLGESMDLDHCIGLVADHAIAFDLCFVFVHNDAGISYTATLAALLDAEVYAIFFGEKAQSLAEQAEGIGCRSIVAPGSHNPLIAKRKIDEVLRWDA